MAGKLKGLSAIALFSIVCSWQPAWAAERVLLKYRGFSRAVAVQDLATLAETGETPDELAGLLDMAGQPPEGLRSLLTESIETNPLILDRALNSYPGEWVLDQLGDAIHPPAGQASRQALRSAIVLSATDDGELTLLEILENYPTPEVVLEGDKIHQAYNRLQGFLDTLSIFY
jgi:hypothetical protein